MGLFFQRQQPQEGRYEALLAEYQNYRRRTSLALEAAEGKSARQTAAAFLPLYDDLSRALACSCNDPAFYQGVEMILRPVHSPLCSDAQIKCPSGRHWL